MLQLLVRLARNLAVPVAVFLAVRALTEAPLRPELRLAVSLMLSCVVGRPDRQAAACRLVGVWFLPRWPAALSETCLLRCVTMRLLRSQLC